jgi:ABC-type transport system involved in multi-copper enzyme maturation permease subunit
MSTVAVAAPLPVTQRALFSSFLAAEWIKLRTVRSTLITLAVAVVLSVGLGVLACQRFAAHLSGLSDPGQHAQFLVNFDATSQSLIGNAFAQLAIGSLGVIVVTSEFGTGMIRASLAAMPQRGRWISAKFLVFSMVAIVIGQILTFSSFGIGQAVLASQHIGVSLSAPGVLRSVVVTGLYVALVGVLGAALGLLIKHTAGALSTLLGILLVLPVLLGVLPVHAAESVRRFLPESIGEQASTVSQISDRLTPWTGIGVMVGYAVVLFVLGLLLLRRRDA